MKKKLWILGNIVLAITIICSIGLGKNGNDDAKVTETIENYVIQTTAENELSSDVDEKDRSSDDVKETIAERKYVEDETVIENYSADAETEVAREIELVEDYFRRLDETNENITFDEESGVAFMNNEILVITDSRVERESLEKHLKKYGGQIVECLELAKYYRVVFEENYSYEELTKLIVDMKDNLLIKHIGINYIVDSTVDSVDEKINVFYPCDPWDGDEWNVDLPEGKNWGWEAIKAPKAWKYISQMKDVKIGIMDTVMDTQHIDLEGEVYFLDFELVDEEKEIFSNRWTRVYVNNNEKYFSIYEEDGDRFVKEIGMNNYSKDDYNHGSHVAGIIGARWNDVGMSGVLGDKADIVLCENKLSNCDNRVNTIYYDSRNVEKLVAEGAKVINISMGFSQSSYMSYFNDEKWKNYINNIENYACTMKFFLEGLIENGYDFLLCVCAGNENNDKLFMDADAKYSTVYAYINESEMVKERIIVVGSIGKKYGVGKKKYVYCYSDFSNIGDRVDIVAPGEEIYSTVPGGYACKSGTSMATPFVTAACGMAYALNPDLTAPEVKELVCSSISEEIEFDGRREGVGLLDLSQVAEKAIASRNESGNSITEIKYDGNGKKVWETLKEYDATGKLLKMMNLEGKCSKTYTWEYTYNGDGKISYSVRRSEDGKVLAESQFVYGADKYYELVHNNINVEFADIDGPNLTHLEYVFKVYDKYGNMIDAWYGTNPKLQAERYMELFKEIIKVYEKNGEQYDGISGIENVVGLDGMPYCEYDDNGKLIYESPYTAYEIYYEYDSEGVIARTMEHSEGELCAECEYEHDEKDRLVKKIKYVYSNGGNKKEMDTWYEYQYS